MSSRLLIFNDRKLTIKDTKINNSYLAASIADFLRYKMIQSNSSFSFESVFSHISKIKELEIAKKANFKIYMYFITTCDPIINYERIKNRVETGGHDVPLEKINNRYLRTLNNLYDAFVLADKVYFFDNTYERINGVFNIFAEKSNDNIFLNETNSIPQWFDEFVLSKLK